jgi:tRNA nucleotidyltransferase (CCA-adding enzyme)
MKVYRVGGSVRDEMLGREIADRDYVVVGATPEEMIAQGFRPVGRDFPVFLHPETKEEYALARTERKRGRGHRGFSFHAAPEVTLEQDLARRDLTINAMARDSDGRLIDPYGGAADLERGVLRHVGPAFVEDPLRVLRVARFAARLGFELAPETARLLEAIAASGELATLAPERVWQELAGALMEARPSLFFELLHRCGALRQLLPEIEAQFKPARRATMPALDLAASAGEPLVVRYAVLAADPAAQRRGPASRGNASPARLRRIEALGARLKAPADCRELALLTARHRPHIDQATSLAPAPMLDLLLALDALRRPARFALCVSACAVYWSARSGGRAPADYPAAKPLEAALAALRSVKGGTVAAVDPRGSAIQRRLRAARLDALREWREQAGLRRSAPARRPTRKA